jgi:rod shape-determining protein MreC
VAVTRPRPRSTRLLVASLVCASLAIITLDYRQGTEGPLAGIGRSAQAVMSPLQEAVTSVTRPVTDFFSGLAHLPSLQDENERLTEQVADLQTQIVGYEELQGRLAELYDQLGLRRTLDPGARSAVVIASGLDAFSWTITIDKGSDDGIQVEQPVVTGSAGSPRLVGHVISVSSTQAEVQLILDRNSTVAARLSGSGEVGAVHGQGDEDLRMEDVSLGTDIDLTGDPVEVSTVSYQVSGQSGIYPPGILIGTVSKVYESPNGLQTSVSIRPAVDFSALEYVLVLSSETGELAGEGG